MAVDSLDRAISERLGDNELFKGLTRAQIAGVMPCIIYSVKEFRGSEPVRGGDGAALGIVIGGGLVVNGGFSRETVRIEESGIFGEAYAFSSQEDSRGRVTAAGSAKVVFLSKDFFYRQCLKECGNKDAHREIVKNLLKILSDNYIGLSKKISYLSAPDLKTKIAMYFCELYEATGSDVFEMPLNRGRLADFFAVARPSLSRELVSLKNCGIICFHRSNVKILDLDALYRIARGNGG